MKLCMCTLCIILCKNTIMFLRYLYYYVYTILPTFLFIATIYFVKEFSIFKQMLPYKSSQAGGGLYHKSF